MVKLEKKKTKTKQRGKKHLEDFHFPALRDGSHNFVFAEAILAVTVNVVAVVGVAAER